MMSLTAYPIANYTSRGPPGPVPPSAAIDNPFGARYCRFQRMENGPDRVLRFYRSRFDEPSREAKQRLRKHLIRSFLQKSVDPSVAVLDLGCGFVLLAVKP